MKITIDNIINFMKEKQKVIITDEQVEEIKKHFYKDVENLVYWSFTEINREQKRKANRKRCIYEKYVYLYEQYVFNQKWEYCCGLVEMMKKEFGKDHLNYMVFLEDDEPYIISTIRHEGRKYNIKVSK